MTNESHVRVTTSNHVAQLFLVGMRMFHYIFCLFESRAAGLVHDIHAKFPCLNMHDFFDQRIINNLTTNQIRQYFSENNTFA